MKKEQIMDFTRRISQSNRGGLVIVIYDIFFAYMEDTKEAHDNGEWENYKTALRNASKTISELISSLDFSYELAGELYRIYVFCRETLAKAMYKRDLKEVELAENLMKKLYTAFAEVMKEDTSPPHRLCVIPSRFMPDIRMEKMIWLRRIRILILPEDS